jgi:hypothetical protein
LIDSRLVKAECTKTNKYNFVLMPRFKKKRKRRSCDKLTTVPAPVHAPPLELNATQCTARGWTPFRPNRALSHCSRPVPGFQRQNFRWDTPAVTNSWDLSLPACPLSLPPPLLRLLALRLLALAPLLLALLL